MLNDSEKSGLLGKLSLLKDECSKIKDSMKKIKEEKEIHFQKKESLQKDIASLIKEIKSTKTNNDSFSRDISGLKKERDSYNQKVKGLIAKIKDLRNSRNALAKDSHIDIGSIKKQIERLEYSIETNAYKYEKEKKINESIKRLRKICNENKGITKLDDELKTLSIEIESAKKTADELHGKLDKAIKDSRNENESFMELSRKISLLKQQQKEEFELFKKLKADYIAKINELKAKSLEISSISSRLASDKREKTSIETSSKKKEIHKKLEDVKEKMKREKVLTKEDILILQTEDQN